MYTKIQAKNGEEINVFSQQYICGTYFIVNNDSAQQGNFAKKENEFHLELRKKALKIGDKLVAGSILDYSGKLPINTFAE